MQTTSLKGFNLSIQQARLWSLQGESQAYRAQCMVRLEGDLDRRAFRQALQHVVNQHTILRTAFYCVPGMEVPLQVVSPHTEVHCEVIDLESLAERHQSAQLAACFTVHQNEPFDLRQSPLIRASLLRLSLSTHILLISLPALCADDTTLIQCIAELGRAYTAVLRGECLAEEPLQYVDVAAWQDELLPGVSAEERQYWDKVDLSQLARMPLPLERESSGEERATETRQEGVFCPQMLSVPVDETLARQIQELTSRYGIPLATYLLACWQVVLWHLTNEPKFMLGVACNGRMDEELTNTLGLYTRFVPIAASLGDDLPFEQAMIFANTSLEEACEEQVYFTWDLRHDKPESGEMASFFPVCFDYHFWPTCFEAGGLSISFCRRYSYTEPFVLKFSTLQVGKGLQIELHYDPVRFTFEQVQRLGTIVHTMLRSTVAQPHIPIGRLPLLTATEQEHVLQTFRSPTTVIPGQVLHQLFEVQAAQTPNQLAVISGTERLTYEELNGQANQLARVLRQYGVGPNVLVGLCMPRSVHMIVGLLGILKAGGAYVPLDPENPPARLAYQVSDTQVPLLLTRQALLSRLPKWNGQILCLETMQEEMVRASKSNLTVVSEPQDLAYVIYTSGSTGMPKGVLISQQSVVNYTLALCELLRGEPGWQYATVSTLAADLGNTAIFCALASGGCLQVLTYEVITSGEAFARWLAQHPIDVLKIVPSHLSAFLSSERAQSLLPRQALVLGGEALPSSLISRLRQVGGSCSIFNHYGPTETTIGVLVNALGPLEGEANCEPQEEESGEIVALGRPITNIQAYVLSRGLQIAPPEVTGELYLGGAGLAIGYLHQAEQTAERFVPNPFVKQAGARLYRTGDLARYTARGQIEFIGRRDNQVKLRGFRIELGEIEAMLRRHAGVWDAVVVLREDGPGEPQLVGYVVARKQQIPTPETLREFLSEYLPEYMIPSLFVLLEAFPLTANGKVDRRQLPRPEQNQTTKSSLLAMPRSPIEEILLETWRDLLAVPTLDIYDDFFQLGGHSLLVTQLIARLQAILQIEIPLRSLFEAPTIVALAPLVEHALRSERATAVPPLVPVPRTQDLPLSFAQQRLWFLDQLEPESTAYLLPRAWRLFGILDTAALERGLGEMVQRHEVLRTTFQVRAGQPVQIIHPVSVFVLPVVDLQALEQEERVREEMRLSGQEAHQPSNLAYGPLLRTYLLRLDVQKHTLLLTLHHIISDAWSNDVFIRELTTLYRAFVDGQPSPLPPLPIQYADFALWQRQWLQGEVLEIQLAYWRRQLAGVPVLELPTDRPRPPVQTFRGATQFLLLPASLRTELIAMSQQANVTLFMLLLAAFQTLLARYSGQNDISIGSAIANRARAEVEGLIGFFVNTLVLRTDLSGNPTFMELLGRVREVALGAYAHQDVPFEQLVEELQPERNLSRPPLFQVVFSVQQVPETRATEATERLKGLTLSALSSEHGTTKYDLLFYVTSSVNGLHCEVQYNTDLFEASTIHRLLDHWWTLLQGIVAKPQTVVADLPLLSELERNILLIHWNTTQMQVPGDLCAHTLFEMQVASTPDAIAVGSADSYLSYAGLNTCANQLARYLKIPGVGPELSVGLCLERSLEMVLGQVAVLKAGGAFVPLDPSYPKERLAFMCIDAQIRVLLTRMSLGERLPEQDAQVVCLDLAWDRIAQQSKANLRNETTSENLAYVIYTSGSTGQPKGVQVEHKGLVNLICWHQQTFAVSQLDRASQIAGVGFDACIWELWPYLTMGASVHIVDEAMRSAPLLLQDWLVSKAITISFLPTPLVGTALSLDWPDGLALRILLTGGDKLHHYPSPSLPFELVNNYGPTENTVVTTSHRVSKKKPSSLTPPIGRPTANTQIYLLDRYLNPVPVGIHGEIVIGGLSLARGYLGRPDLTAERFIPNQFSKEPGARLYKTGDLARYLSDGTIEFLGRNDHQVKLRGFRIELSEIEVVLEGHPAVRESVVLLREDAPEDQRLLAYVVGTRPEVALENGQLLAYLQQRLPDYMLPSHIVQLEELPLTPNGKVDRALLARDSSDMMPDQSINTSSTPIETQLASILASLLKVEHVGIDDNFFMLGGHSLLGTQLITRIAEIFDVGLPLRSLFNAPTVRLLSAEIEQRIIARLETMSEEEALRLLE